MGLYDVMSYKQLGHYKSGSTAEEKIHCFYEIDTIAGVASGKTLLLAVGIKKKYCTCPFWRNILRR